MVAIAYTMVLKKEDEDEIELSLELSLGGNHNKLLRSSSVALCLPVVRDDSDTLMSIQLPHSSIARTSSLPVESEKEWRKRKEMQNLRRLEAKRRRSEKQRLLKEDKEGCGTCSSQSQLYDKKKLLSHCKNSLPGSSFQSTNPQVSECNEDMKPDTLGGLRAKMEDMPSVFTKGDDPNGRRVDGILYKYGKGEDVRIMCICHGCFYSPADFIRHAGGTNVDYPLKHIVMNPTSSLL